MRWTTVPPAVKNDSVSVGGGGGPTWEAEYEVGDITTLSPDPLPCDFVVTSSEPANRKRVDGSDGQRVCIVMGVLVRGIGVAPLVLSRRRCCLRL